MPSNFAELVGVFLELISLAIPLVFAVTLLIVIWAIVDAWIINGGDETKVEKGKQIALAGVIALVVMSGIWGIVELLQSSLFG